MLTALTSFDSVRAALGLNSKELSDATLGAQLFDLDVETKILAIGADAYTKYEAAALESTPEAEAYVRALRLYATHIVAYKCTNALPLFMNKAITDGKAGMYRDGNSPYTHTIDMVTASFAETKRGAEEAYGVYTGAELAAQTPFLMMGVSSLDTDPVTGE